MSIIALLFAFIVFCFVIWAVRALSAAFGLGEPLSTVVFVVVVLVALIVIARTLGLVSPLR